MIFDYLFRDLTAPKIGHTLRKIADAALFQKYGRTPDAQILQRFAEEWAAMERTCAISDVAALYELTVWLRQNRFPYWMRSCAGSSLILFLLGITTGNPLPPHYYCPTCQTVQWQTTCTDGFDLPQNAVCLYDGTPLIPDGHDIPWQILFGRGDFEPMFDVDLTEDLYEPLRDAWKSHWLSVPPSSPAAPPSCDDERLRIRLSHLTLTFHRKRSDISHTFYDHEYTAADRLHILSHWKILVNDEANFTYTLPQPDRIADLIALFGLSYTAGLWDNTTIHMIEKMGYSPADLIAYRDDIYRYLSNHGFSENDVWHGMNRARKGLPLPLITAEMQQARDKWVLARCEKAEYLFPKAHAVEYLFFALKAYS